MLNEEQLSRKSFVKFTYSKTHDTLIVVVKFKVSLVKSVSVRIQLFVFWTQDWSVFNEIEIGMRLPIDDVE